MRELLRRLWATIQRDAAALAAWIDRELPIFFGYLAWLTRQAWFGFARYLPIVRRSPTAQLIAGGAALLVVALGIWWLVGVSLPQWYVTGELEKPSDFGDMFGAASALFSALAFLGVLIAVHYQRKEIQDNARSQKEQLDIAQKTARIQAYTFLAEFNRQLMAYAPPHEAHRYRNRAGESIDRAIRLIQKLDNKTEDDMLAVAPVVLTMADFAVSALHDVTAEVHSFWHTAEMASATDTSIASYFYLRISALLTQWRKHTRPSNTSRTLRRSVT